MDLRFSLLPKRPVERPGSPTAGRSIGLRQIVDNLGHIGFLDGRPIDLDHFGHLCLPEILLELWALGLGLDVVGRVAGRAVVLNTFEIRTWLECGGLIGKLVRNTAWR